MAALAGAMGGVEREDPRLELHQRRSVLRTGEPLREGERPCGLLRLFITGQDLDLHQPVSQRHRGLDRVCQALA